MKALLDFIKYNNAFPVILFVTLLATGAVFAASPELRESVFVSETAPLAAPQKADASVLLAAQMEAYDATFRIDALKEDTKTYYVTYSYQTFEVVGNAWQSVRKTKHLEVAKDFLGKRDLKAYLASQIEQVLAQEKAYLVEAQRLASGESTKRDTLKYAALIGGEVTPEKAEEQATEAQTATETTLQETSAPPVQTLPVSQEELQRMIVAAVAEFLAVDTSMPEEAEDPTENTKSDEEASGQAGVEESGS